MIGWFKKTVAAVKPSASSKPQRAPYLGGLPSVNAPGGSVNVRHTLPVHNVGVSAK